MFSDIFKIREIADWLSLEVEVKMVSSTEGAIDDSLIGGSRKHSDAAESTVVTGIDTVMNHHLQETSFTKEAYKKCIKRRREINQRQTRRTETRKSKAFYDRGCRTNHNILAHFKIDQFFIGESMNPDSMVALLDYRVDGVTPFMVFFKDG
ncbi:translationally-controlled tumor protein-like [Tenrec ecaudatus]|uniref:translationally-controlled tumor protein-like n=1 Tax=Tenrec ecaudatus TaxID=94439 RepID=UPI003F5A397E